MRQAWWQTEDRGQMGSWLVQRHVGLKVTTGRHAAGTHNFKTPRDEQVERTVWPCTANQAHLWGCPARRAQRAAAAAPTLCASWAGSPRPAGSAGRGEASKPPLEARQWLEPLELSQSACSASGSRPVRVNPAQTPHSQPRKIPSTPTCTVVSSSAARSPKVMSPASSWYVSYARHFLASLYAPANSTASLASATSPNRSACIGQGAGRTVGIRCKKQGKTRSIA